MPNAVENFPLLVTREFASRMRPGRPDDPLLRQVLPTTPEDEPATGFTLDAVGDLASSDGTGCLSKYAGRTLMIATPACAIHCRYCFRRHFPYASHSARRDDFSAAVDSVRQRDSIREVILSGGDPWMVGDPSLRRLIEQLAAIDHVRRLRFHTRMPIVLPNRLTDELWTTLRQATEPPRRLEVRVVVHANHPQEFDGEVRDGLAKLQRAGVQVLNQSVLLRGINDDVDVLEALSEELLSCGVMPYYLHQLDRAQGTQHFEVKPSRGLELVAELRRRLPGYAVPQYVQEIAGERSKTPILHADSPA